MNANVIVYFAWCVFFSLVAAEFLTGLPFFIIIIINSIAAYTMLMPMPKVDDDD